MDVTSQTWYYSSLRQLMFTDLRNGNSLMYKRSTKNGWNSLATTCVSPETFECTCYYTPRQNRASGVGTTRSILKHRNKISRFCMQYVFDHRCTSCLFLRPCAFLELPVFSLALANPGALQNRSYCRIANSVLHVGNIFSGGLSEHPVMDVSARRMQSIS